MMHLILAVTVLAVFCAQLATMRDYPKTSVSLFALNLCIIIGGLLL